MLVSNCTGHSCNSKIALGARLIIPLQHSLLGGPAKKERTLLPKKLWQIVVQLLSCVWLFVTPTDCRTQGFSVLLYLPEFVQIHVHWVGDAIQPSHLLPPSSHFTFSLSQDPVSQLFTSDGQSIGASASVLLVNIQGWFPLGFTSLIFLQSKGLSRVFSSTTI